MNRHGHDLKAKPPMHVINAAIRPSSGAAILTLFPDRPSDASTGRHDEPERRLSIVDGLVSTTRQVWTEPFETFGNFAA